MLKTSEIREKFLTFFEKNGHARLESSPLIPQNDPTLLFANAGMNQFKDYFTGKAHPDNKRAVTVQKCVRAGGKHNDLENVGFTARHHTFFEMLGNFSFGDYFKSEAIDFAWKFLTEELKLPKDKLFVTVHESDQEARQIWHKEQKVPLERIFFRGDKDNFWEMGETGPCGPCSEIFYDHGQEHTDGADTSDCILDDEGRYVEIWNLVFMQYEKFKKSDGSLDKKNLPNPCVDTGAGLERLAAALQGVYWNYDSDLFGPIINKIESLSGKKYSDPQFVNNIRVISDHARAATLLITDGVIPSNEGRGYVLRRIIRRATRHLDELGMQKPTLPILVESVFESLNHTYKQNENNKDLAVKLLKLEEEKFRTTLKNGLDLLNKEIKKIKKDTLSGEVAFKLYDTYGFPLDLTETILREKDLKVDSAGFEKSMQKQKENSKSSANFAATDDDREKYYAVFEKYGETEFLGYEKTESEATLIAFFQGAESDEYALVFDRTPFYAESGGQVGDSGEILNLGQIVDTQKPVDGLFVHFAKLTKAPVLNQKYTLRVNSERRELIKRNHSATHLLQSALIEVLGNHIKQAGSRVSDESLRFDFTQPEAITKDEIRKIEDLVNSKVLSELSVTASLMTKDEATNKGAMALFGEKYGDTVRVLEMGDFSLELCGGTHIENTKEIGLFTILSESSLSSGVRRIEATTSKNAIDYLLKRSHVLATVERTLSSNTEGVLSKLDSLQDMVKKKNKQIKELESQLSKSKNDNLFDDAETLANGIELTTVEAKDVSVKDFRNLSDNFIDKNQKGVLLMHTTESGKFSYLLRTHKGNKKINCSDLIKNNQSIVEGRGGGRPDMAQGSGTPSHSQEFIQKIKIDIGNL